MREESKIRNIAIIAHVDHGKTTLVDQLLKQSGTFRENENVAERVMDKNDLEREKGITILAKNTSIEYKDFRMNIVDTPGHADFGGEVERIMTMVDGVILVVDAFEGCMPQTRFVLKKALAANLVPIVIINKMDKAFVRPAEVLDEVYDLFIDLDANEEQLDFPVLYAIGVKGICSKDPDLSDKTDLKDLLDQIVETIPAPKGDRDGSLQAQITLMDYSEYVGKMGICTIKRGSLRVGDAVAIMSRDGAVRQTRVNKLYGFSGLKQVDIEAAAAGDIVAIGGLGEINVGETICDVNQLDPLPFIEIEEPTLEMRFLINNSPFAGKDGEPLTSRKLRERLLKECEADIALQVNDTDSADAFRVAGRGELHLAILIEKMRREGLEFQVSMPQVIYKEMDGVRCEPFEFVTLDIPEAYIGDVMNELNRRHGVMQQMMPRGSETRLEFIVPTRGLVGFRTDFLTLTHGYGIMNATYEDHRPFAGAFSTRDGGVLVAFETGISTAYGLKAAEERGELFIGAGVDVYEGMVIGEANRKQDIPINVCKTKKLTNTRASGKDDAIQLKGARKMSLEECIAFLAQDEYLEVTPNHLRLRKRFLRLQDRQKYAKHAAE